MRLPLALKWAGRELRGGLKGFRILAACLALGVAAIAASGSLRAAVDRALAEDSRALLGGDLDLRQSHEPPNPEQRAALEQMGRITAGIEMRVMASVDGNRDRALAELKGVDAAYPLAGRLELDPPLDHEAAFGFRGGVWGAAADAHLLNRLGLTLGGRVKVGEIELEIRAIVAKEPDRVAAALSFGPRLMAANQAVEATGLIRPGAMIRHSIRLALAEGQSLTQAKTELARRFPDAAWQLRDSSDATPGLGRFLDALAAFLALAGLTALLTGGIGVANAVKAYVDGKIPAIATLKCLGAPSGLIFQVYLSLAGLMALAGILIGLVLGASAVPLALALAGDSLPLPMRGGLYPQALAQAAGLGALAALTFTLWPLARAAAVTPQTLFRGESMPVAGRPGRKALAALVLSAAALAALAVLTSTNRPLAAWFVGVSALAMALFQTLAWAVAKLATRQAARRRDSGPARRVALANLRRPGGAAGAMILSLGLGLSVLVTIALVEGNLAAQFGERAPGQAPSFYFIDVQPDQAEALKDEALGVDPQALVERAPMVRGRITSIGGIPVAEARIAGDVQWAARGDRGLSTAAAMPAGTRLEAGQWWPADYAGPPLVSVDAQVAKGFGLKVGDRLGLNVLGREIEAEIASLRRIQWSSLSMNFAFLLSPHALDGAPFTYIATVRARPELDAALEKAVTDRLPNISAIRVKEALEAARAVIEQADLAVRLAGAATLASGAMVLAGAVMAGHRRRTWEAVALKVLGATRGQLWRAHLTEFAVIGLIAGLAAALVGSFAARAILIHVMKAEWTFLPATVAATVAVCLIASLLAGFAGAWRALGVKAAPVLRIE